MKNGLRKELVIPVSWLLHASALYLSLPYYIFLLGWVKLPLALLLLIGSGILYIFLTKGIRQDSQTASLSLPAAVIFLLWIAIAGYGTAGHGGDAYKHITIFDDLVTRKWPVYYFGSKHVPLLYYLFYYLPPALIGKTFGLAIGNAAMYVWTGAGAILAYLWFSFLSKGNGVKNLLFFIFFGSLSVVGWSIFKRSGRFDEWMGMFQYSSNNSLLFYVPQHVLPGFISAGIIFYAYETKKMLGKIGWWISLLPLWSPFVFIGAIFYLPVLLDRKSFKTMVLVFILSFILISGVSLLYLSGSTVSTMKHITNPPWFLWAGWRLWVKAGIFHVLWVVWFAICLVGLRAQHKKIPLLLIWTGLILLILPFFRYGAANDLVMRSSIPALSILSIYAYRSLSVTFNRYKGIYVALFLLMCMPACQDVFMYFRTITWKPPVTTMEKMPPYFIPQYTGTDQGVFFKTVGR